MASGWSGFRDSLFAVFYIMTEQSNKHSRGSKFGTGLCAVIYLIDAGQVLRALILAEFGWDASVVSLIGKVDIINVLFKVVSLF